MNGKKILMVVAPANFRDEELLEPKKVFEGYGAQVTVTSTAREPKGMFGARVSAEPVEDMDVNEYDALVFVGGSGASVYFNNTRILEMAKQSYEKGKITAAICIAPVILANAGILEGKKATVWNGEFKTMLESKGAQYTGNSVEQDGKIITANGPSAAKQFGETISKSL